MRAVAVTVHDFDTKPLFVVSRLFFNVSKLSTELIFFALAASRRPVFEGLVSISYFYYDHNEAYTIREIYPITGSLSRR